MTMRRALSSTSLKVIVASAWLAVLLLGSAAFDDAGFSPPPTAVPAGPPCSTLCNKILRQRQGCIAEGRPLRPPRRMARTDVGCAGTEDIAIYQSHASPLPSGVPAYNVMVMNRCLPGIHRDCEVAGIHVRCGWFSSVSLVNPRKFQRLGPDNCLLNDGRLLLGGETIYFKYANSFLYKLSVRHVATCCNHHPIGTCAATGDIE